MVAWQHLYWFYNFEFQYVYLEENELEELISMLMDKKIYKYCMKFRVEKSIEKIF